VNFDLEQTNSCLNLPNVAYESQIDDLSKISFSKLTKEEKIDRLSKFYFDDQQSQLKFIQTLKKYWLNNSSEQKIFDEFSENTLSNYILPFGVAPHFLINGKNYTIPMVIEESSVVAAASKAAKFWMERGGFVSEVLGTTKVGQVHFYWKGQDTEKLKIVFEQIKDSLLNELTPLSQNMKMRGGGIKSVKLIDKSEDIQNEGMLGPFQLFFEFETCDAMGANFINSILEKAGQVFTQLMMENSQLTEMEKEIQIIFAILSNYTSECRVRTKVSCHYDDLNFHDSTNLSGRDFALKFARAIYISKVDISRAVTHNKGIFNGIDAVILATGNDFRAIEACGHAYASRNGTYQGLTDVVLDDVNQVFHFSLEVPLALGTIGGLTKLHPLSELSLELLSNPTAKNLMEIVGAVGLAQNFSAVRSLITTGIQKGHMKMHLINILNQFQATVEEREKTKEYFSSEVITYKAVREFLESLRSMQ
jgi:hydroxymethylglutaryl-CoA reductase